jgi:hypothetical protein
MKIDISDKILFGGILVCLIALVVLGAITLHDGPISNVVKTDVELSYYLQVNDSMTKTERYDLALLICKEAYYEMSNDQWWPPHKDTWIKNNAFRLVKNT